jgi:uncharacterized protein YodC (DUF2158 family)
MDTFKVGELVVREGGGGPVMTVAEVRFEARWFVRIEGDEPNAWALANCLIPYAD